MIFCVHRIGYETIHILCGDYEPIASLKFKIRERHDNLKNIALSKINIVYSGRIVSSEKFCCELSNVIWVHAKLNQFPTIMRSGFVKPNEKKPLIEIYENMYDIQKIDSLAERFLLDNCYSTAGRSLSFSQLKSIVYQIYNACEQKEKETYETLRLHYLGKVHIV